jgi:16S rRNA (guanine527-N7)-methyltransferase
MSAFPLEPYGAADFQRDTNVSRETMDRLSAFEAFLNERGTITNLVARSTLPDFWRRHALDSAQLLSFAPPGITRWVDLGSGGGFPGLIVATLIAQNPKARVRLIEATRKKADFLEAAAVVLDVRVDVVNARIEATPAIDADVVSARALASLLKLTPWLKSYVDKGAIALLLKGQDIASELTETAKYWTLKYRQHPSISDPRGTILEVTGIKHERPARTSDRYR